MTRSKAEALLEVYSFEELCELNDITPAEIIQELYMLGLFLELPVTPVVLDDE